MRRIFILILFLLFFTGNAFADIMPSSSSSIRHYGFGVLNLTKSFNVYAKPDENSAVLKRIDYEKEAQYQPIINEPSSLENTIVAYVPSKAIALVTVESNQENGWYEIYYDQKKGLTGWVKQTDYTAFKTWRNAFYDWGKKNGLYIFRDVPDDKRRLYSQDSRESQGLESFTHAKYINFSMIRGNWMLVSVLDIGQHTKIGWMQWRDENGTLLLFPYFK